MIKAHCRSEQGPNLLLQRLQLEYLDLFLIRQPFGDVYSEWRVMEDLYKEGHIRAIGVSNFQPDRLMDLIIHNKIAPVVNRVEIHPFHQQNETQQFLQENNVQIESWGPFADCNFEPLGSMNDTADIQAGRWFHQKRKKNKKAGIFDDPRHVPRMGVSLRQFLHDLKIYSSFNILRA